jgi:hypothetical protein
MKTLTLIKAQAAALIIQFGLNMAHKVCDEAFAHDPEAGKEIKALLDRAHGLLQHVAQFCRPFNAKADARAEKRRRRQEVS